MYSTGDLEEMTGQTRRGLQLWVENHLLKPSPETAYAGRGIPRSFDSKEAIIALFLAGANSARTWPIGWLSRMAVAVRSLIETNEKFRNDVNRSIAGQVNLFMILDWGDMIDFLVDPTPAEACEKTFFKLDEDCNRHQCIKVIILMTPWLERARAPLPRP